MLTRLSIFLVYMYLTSVYSKRCGKSFSSLQFSTKAFRLHLRISLCSKIWQKVPFFFWKRGEFQRTLILTFEDHFVMHFIPNFIFISWWCIRPNGLMRLSFINLEFDYLILISWLATFLKRDYLSKIYCSMPLLIYFQSILLKVFSQLLFCANGTSNFWLVGSRRPQTDRRN